MDWELVLSFALISLNKFPQTVSTSSPRKVFMLGQLLPTTFDILGWSFLHTLLSQYTLPSLRTADKG